MRIAEYPRPHNDSGIGFHFFPDSNHTTRADADRWIPRLRAMGASWLVLQTPPERPVPDSFLQRLMMADIEPVVMLSPPRVVSMETRPLRETARALADSGVHYVVLYDRPNDRENWLVDEWGRPSLVERFVDYLVPALEVTAAEGLHPVLPPLDPFGAYWDTVFLRAMLNSLMRRGLGGVLERSAIGIRNFANNRPLNWGAGGRDAWPKARPYVEQPEGQDHRGFRLFEWYEPLVREQVGRSLPLIACANGPQATWTQRHQLDPVMHAQRVAEMSRMIVERKLPDFVFNHAFWLLAAGPGDPNHSHAWFDPDGNARLPATKALVDFWNRQERSEYQEIASAPAARSAAPPPRAVRGNGGKPIEHYLLLPTFEWGISQWHLVAVQEYVEAFLPTCGFSVDQARLASRVTVVGNEQGVSREAVEQLQAAGCHVERIAGRSGAETQQLLRELARNKQRSR